MPRQPLLRPPDSVATGRMAASQSPVGLLHPDLDEPLADFQRLNSVEARAAFADRWILRSARRLEEVWPMLYELLRIVRDGELFSKAGYLEQGRTYPDFKAYFEDVVKQPFTRWGELEATYHFVERYAPELRLQPYSIANDGRISAAARATVDDPRRLDPGRPSSSDWVSPGDGKIRGPRIYSQKDRASRNQVSVRTQQTLDRLARSRPDLLQRVIAGDIGATEAERLLTGRPRRIRVPVEPTAAARMLREHFSADELSELVSLLAEVS